jgi:hypothetical protein
MIPNESDLSVVQICHHCRNRRHLCPSKWRHPPTALDRLLGSSTQNAPCKGDGSDDPAELRVRIAADKIESKSGICNSLAVTLEGAFSHSQPPRESVGPIVNAVGHFGHR